MLRCGHKGRDRVKEIDRERDRDGVRDRESDRERDKDRETETQTEATCCNLQTTKRQRYLFRPIYSFLCIEIVSVMILLEKEIVK